MANTSYMASRRNGGRAAPGSRRVNVTLHDQEFEALRQRADASHKGVAGEAADLIRVGLMAEARAHEQQR